MARSKGARSAAGAPADPLQWVRVPAPDGDIIVVFSAAGIAAVAVAGPDGGRVGSDALPTQLKAHPLREADSPPAGLLDALRSGDGAGLSYDLRGATEFDRAVWRATLSIPKGSVRTYSDVARAIGRPRATRAVGNALGRNPIPILIPCHRVVRQSGDTGHYGLGDAMKRRLLEAEGVNLRAMRGRRVRQAG